jgi:ribosome-associated protein
LADVVVQVCALAHEIGVDRVGAKLGALVRQARKDAVPLTNAAVSQGLAPRQGRAYRELFKLVRSVLTDGQSDGTPEEEPEDE